MKVLKVGLAMGGLIAANPVTAAGGHTAVEAPTRLEVARGASSAADSQAGAQPDAFNSLHQIIPLRRQRSVRSDW